MLYASAAESDKYKTYSSPIINLMGLFLCLKFGRDAMCELSNAEVLTNWQECNRGNRQQGADYWYDFMAKRARRGDKDAKDKIALMDRLK